MKKRKIIGVVAAEASSIEQRQILNGILTAAQQKNADTVIFTNIYNSYYANSDLYCENRIYEMVRSQELDAIIMIAESFVDDRLRQQIFDLISERKDIPLVAISTDIPQLHSPNTTFLNAGDSNDMYDIVCHLIEEHGYQEIDILTGPIDNEAAALRVAGYRRALNAHHIPFDAARVHYGNFWTNSGEELAKQYLDGVYPLPQAIACANDHMAFGILDVFAANNVRVPEDVAVTGYENVQERIFHTPLLSTYQRNRFAIGVEAVNILLQKQSKERWEPPCGEWVPGRSCPCKVTSHDLHTEMEGIRTQQTYNQWSLFSTMEMKLTQCSTLEEFLYTLGNYQFMVRYSTDIIVCLYDNWYTQAGGQINDRMTFRSVVEWMRSQPTKAGLPYHLSDLLYGEAAGYYYTPLFFHKRLLGMIVLRYDRPDCYDVIYRNWLKAVSNGLEFLRMKNDIQYLMQCQSLSESYDTVTGLYLRHALLRELAAAAAHADEQTDLFLLVIRENRHVLDLHLQSETEKIRSSQAIAACMRSIQSEHSEYLAIPADNVYLFAGVGTYSKQKQEQLMDRLRTMLLHSSDCFADSTPETYLLVPRICKLHGVQLSEQLSSLMEEAESKLMNQIPLSADTLQFTRLRMQLYHQTQAPPTTDECCRKFCFSEGYFRARYKSLYGISFHQDCIRAKIYYAKYLLLTSSASVSSIAQQCGYREDNYFLRQFRSETGMTPKQYRKMEA